VTLQNVNDANLRLLFRGFGAGLTADGVRAASALEGGSTVISLGAGEVVLQNYAATIPDGDITVQAACYGEGTRIATLRGEVPIERLRVGDQVVSVFGGSAPVRWIGWRALDLRRHPRPELAWPVRVRAGAFADGVPRRDLVMSADHAVYVDSVLIPVRTLVNGTTIRREPAAGVVWYHVELPMHDVILAEGLAAESYLDTGNRSAFANGGKAVALNPDFAREVWEAEACAAQVTQGARHARVVARLAARALDQGHRRNDQRTSSG